MKNASKIEQDEAPHAGINTHIQCSERPTDKIVVVGAGTVGMRFCLELLKREPLSKITIFGNEPYEPYNRVQLSSLLAGEICYEDILTTLPDQKQHPNFSVVIETIHCIDHHNNVVIDIEGHHHSFDKLIIATGARPHVPDIRGVQQAGVYTFRNLKDAEFLCARISRARHVVVIGGGLLGLESAKALSRFHTKVTLVQQGQRLMNRQLDEESSAKLQETVESLGIRVIVNSGVRSITGDGRVTGVVTRDKEHLPCDTVLICAGIKPNAEIARSAKIQVRKGIVVDDELKTSVSNIYAIGECCEHRGSTYGFANPGYEQAAVLADNLSGGSAKYIGSLEISRLKVIGTPICSIGNAALLGKHPLEREFKFRDNKSSIYRKIITRKGKLIGAVGFGDWHESRKIQEAYQNKRKIRLWQKIHFLLTGNLFNRDQYESASQWPSSTVICQCNNISQGELVKAIEQGGNSVSQLQSMTAAGTVCGSCKPLLAQLVGQPNLIEKEKAWPIILVASLLAFMTAASITILPGQTVSTSVLITNSFESIWNDKFWKQTTGFTLLGMSALGLFLSLRKEIKSTNLGSFAYWRILHIFLGAACAVTLILHTGLHLGSNFNQILMIDFIAILILGSLSGMIFSLSHTFDASSVKKIRSAWTWAHILFTWPLPILLSFHILTVYYF